MSITIKQAFQKLAMVTGAGVKNPWFVIRNLAQTFADVADNVDGGGDKVTVTPITDSGTKIATIKVNNTTSELYAPDSSATYSTTEKAVGKWTDNATIYEKVISFTFASGQYTHVAFDTTVDKLLLIEIIPMGCSSYYTNSSDYLRAYRYTYESNDGIMFERGGSGNVSGDVIIRYTKASS